MFTSHRRAAAAAVAAGAALVLTACGGGSSASPGASASSAPSSSPSAAAADSPLKGLSAEQVLDKARAATASAKSLHYTAEGATDGQKVSMDVRSDKDRGVVASVAFGGQEIKIVHDFKDAYVGGDNPLIAALSGGKAASGKWVKTSVKNPSFKSALEIADPEKATEQFFKLEPGQKVALGTPKTVDGQQTVALVISGGKSGGGTMYVAAQGTPYPLLIETAADSKDQGVIRFSEFDKPVEITLPDPEDVVVAPGS